MCVFEGTMYENEIEQWRIQERGPGPRPPTYFYTKTAPSPPYLRVSMTGFPLPYLRIWIRHCRVRSFCGSIADQHLVKPEKCTKLYFSNSLSAKHFFFEKALNHYFGLMWLMC